MAEADLLRLGPKAMRIEHLPSPSEEIISVAHTFLVPKSPMNIIVPQSLLNGGDIAFKHLDLDRCKPITKHTFNLYL